MDMLRQPIPLKQYDFFDVEGHALAVDRRTGRAWAWIQEIGAWSDYLGLVYESYSTGPVLRPCLE